MDQGNSIEIFVPPCTDWIGSRPSSLEFGKCTSARSCGGTLVHIYDERCRRVKNMGTCSDDKRAVSCCMFTILILLGPSHLQRDTKLTPPSNCSSDILLQTHRASFIIHCIIRYAQIWMSSAQYFGEEGIIMLLTKLVKLGRLSVLLL